MTNTDRLIANLEHATKWGSPCITFSVGKYTGNGSAVINALRRRGYEVAKVARATYQLSKAAA